MQKNIAWLSSLRGIGCLFVLAAHLGASSTNYGMYFNGCGKIGVWLFMIFSGFWFLYPLCQRQQALKGRNLMGYYDTISGSSVDFHGTGIYSGWKGTGAAFVADRWIWAFLVYAGYYEIFPDCTAVLAVAADDKE